MMWLFWLGIVLLVLYGCVSPVEEQKCITFLTPQLQTKTVPFNKSDIASGKATWNSDGVSATIDGRYYASSVYSIGTCTGK